MSGAWNRAAAAEALGTALLAACVIGSGVMAERLSAGNVAVALLANALATGAGLVALILALGPVSGAHFNPAVTLSAALDRALPWPRAFAYMLAQTLGAFIGAAGAHAMFGLPLFSASRHVRGGGAQLFSEAIATAALLLVIQGASRRNKEVTPFAVGAYITAAYWFTSSTSFANPALTLARAASDTFAGIRPADAPGFVAAEFLAAAAATYALRALWPARAAQVNLDVTPGKTRAAAPAAKTGALP